MTDPYKIDALLAQYRRAEYAGTGAAFLADVWADLTHDEGSALLDAIDAQADA